MPNLPDELLLKVSAEVGDDGNMVTFKKKIPDTGLAKEVAQALPNVRKVRFLCAPRFDLLCDLRHLEDVYVNMEEQKNLSSAFFYTLPAQPTDTQTALRQITFIGVPKDEMEAFTVPLMKWLDWTGALESGSLKHVELGTLSEQGLDRVCEFLSIYDSIQVMKLHFQTFVDEFQGMKFTCNNLQDLSITWSAYHNTPRPLWQLLRASSFPSLHTLELVFRADDPEDKDFVPLADREGTGFERPEDAAILAETVLNGLRVVNIAFLRFERIYAFPAFKNLFGNASANGVMHIELGDAAVFDNYGQQIDSEDSHR